MSALRAARSGLFVSALCLTCGASGALAQLVPADSSHRHHSLPAGACHCTKHRRCPHTRAAKEATHRRTQCETSKPSAPPHGSSGSAPPAPWTTFPTPNAPGSSASGTPPATPTGATPPVESPTAPVAPARVEVTAEDTGAFRFVLSRASVPAGKVIIEFVNHGQDEHNLNAVEPVEGSLAGSIPNTAPNAHPSLTLDLRPGSYTLFCSIADHEAKGMKATLVVN